MLTFLKVKRYISITLKMSFLPLLSPALHVMVASYTWGIDADRFDGLSDDDVIDQVLEDLSAVHDRDLEFLKKNLREGIVKRWANDPNTLGAFAMFTPYQVRLSFLQFRF
jgi:monoamine oxidase